MKDQAYVFKIGDRYFHKFGKKGQVLTAYWLAGARMIGTWEESKIETLEGVLTKQGKSFSKILIGELPGNEGEK